MYKRFASMQFREAWLPLCIGAFCVTCWVMFSLTRHSLDDWGDMVENYAWGMEWQWGNNKHPPMFSWITAAWFHIFPINETSYYLLNEVNLAVALLLLALAMRRVMSIERVVTAVALTLLCSRFGLDKGYQYNANTAQLPFVAGYVWALMAAFQDRKRTWFILAGLFAGAALLTKYYAAVMIAAITFGLWVGLRPPLRFALTGLTIAGIVAFLVALPHLVWAAEHGWPTLQYMHESHDENADHGGAGPFLNSVRGIYKSLYLSLAVWGLSFIYLRKTECAKTANQKLGVLMFVTSVILTLLAALIEGIVPTYKWFIPIFPLTGWALMDLTSPALDAALQMRRVLSYGACYLVFMVAMSVSEERSYQTYSTPDPYALRRTVAQDVTALYRSTYAQPIQYVAGTFPLPYVMSFYSSDHPHGLFGTRLDRSLWIDQQRLNKGNKVAICDLSGWARQADPSCPDKAKSLFGAPDRVDILTYKISLPEQKKISVQRYEVLLWKPHSIS